MGAITSIFGGKPKKKAAPAPAPEPVVEPVVEEEPRRTEQAGAAVADGMAGQRRRAMSQRSQLTSSGAGTRTRGGINIPGGV